MHNGGNVVVCVLKTGTFQPRIDRPYSVSYGPEHVQWLRDQFATQAKTPHRFVCMSDIDIPGVETIRLKDNLPGWWSKLEIFREFERAAYVDLDTVLVGDPSVYLFHSPRRFVVSAGIHYQKFGSINTSLMTWEGDYRFVYQQFMEERERVMATYIEQAHWGDQGFLRDIGHNRIRFVKFQDQYPGAILQYRRDFQNPVRSRPTRNPRYGRVHLTPNWQLKPRIVFFNGEAKPWDVEEPWIPRLVRP